MVVMMPVFGMRLVKVAFRAVTGLVFHLHRRMVYLIVFFKEMMNTIQQRIVIVRRHDLNVQRHQRFFAYQPDVHVVNIAYFRKRTAHIAL